MTSIPERIDSKFRFVLVAAQRAEQLMRGARPHLETAAGKPTRLAQEEVRRGLIAWDYGPPPMPEAEGEEVGPVEETEGEVH